MGDILGNLLQHDPSAEVRKACLQHLDLSTPAGLEAILTRSRDVDAGVRRLFFARRMREIDPRHLDTAQRDALLRAGLSDRYAMGTIALS